MTSVGIGLAGVTYYSGENPFLDRFRTADSWSPIGSAAYKGGSATFDANGYPTFIPVGQTLSAPFGVDPSNAGTTHRYVVTYSGSGTISFQLGTSIVSQSAGKMVINVSTSASALNINATDPNNPIRDIHIVREDQVALYNSGAMFNPAFIDKIDDFSVLRFMDWGATNDTGVTSWSQRKTLDSAFWGGGHEAVPIEVMVRLANETHNDMWYNIPTRATDDYVRQALTYIHNNLSPDLNLHLEYSNEVWNWGFQQATYAQNLANQMWGVDANGNGKIDSNEAVGGGNSIYYGYRSAQVQSIAQSVYGADASTRLIGVLATQTMNVLAPFVVQGVQKAGLGSVSDLFHDYAITTYFGDELSGGDAKDQATVLAWARGGEAGMAAAFYELEYGGTMDANYSLAYVRNVYMQHKANADKYGLDLVAYEGNLSAVAYQYPAAVQGEVVDFFNRLEADPRMGALMTKMVSDFASAGGTLLTAFNDVGPTSVYGTWGLVNDIYSSSPRMDALIAATKSLTVTTLAVTDLPSYALAGTYVDLTYTGTAAFTGSGTKADNIITGGNGGNKLYGYGGNDTLTGGAGADLLDGGTGDDRMVGGAGNDIYYVDSIGDVVVELPGGGIDEVRTTLNTYTLQADLENLTFVGTGAFTGTGNDADNVITGSATDPNKLYGGAGNDTLTGGASADSLYGGVGNDTLVGGGGDDLLDGGAGADRMTGGAGNDIYIVDNAGDVVVELANEGIDEVRTALNTYVLPANVENLTFTGTGAFTATGNALNNIITGSATGANFLDGGAGADTMIGGSANDVYIVDNANDVVVEQPNGGIDEVRASIATYVLSANVENLTYTGTGNFTGTGNALNNVITGGAGNDWLDGGAGDDRMIGGAGNDTYVVNSIGDVIVELANGGIDTVRTSLNIYTLSANIENLTFTGAGAFIGIGNDAVNIIVGSTTASNKLYGGAGGDTLTGGASADILDGGAGADRMVGGAGNDLYYVDNTGDVIVEQPNEGIDEVRSTATYYQLSDNVENLTFTGLRTASFTGIGNASNNIIVGSAGNDTLVGGAGNDTLIGGAGNDTLRGDAGADRMIGGTGNDSYDVDNIGDLVIENANEGTDTVLATITYTLPANVEQLYLVGTSAIDGTGNALANVIYGNAAANRILGMDGNDQINAGAGDDYIDGGNGDDNIIAGDGNDILIGGPGKDYLVGGAGADTFVFRPGDLATTLAAADTVVDFTRAEGDKLDFSAFRQAVAGGKLTFLGTAAFGHHAGEIRVQGIGPGQGDLMIDVNGNGVADFHILIGMAAGAPTAADFILG